jgi:hypothetical protein
MIEWHEPALTGNAAFEMLPNSLRRRCILGTAARENGEDDDQEGFHLEMLRGSGCFAREEERGAGLVANHSETNG